MEQETYQFIVNNTLRWVDLQMKAKVVVDENISRGYGNFLDKKITMPTWLNQFDVVYRIYYIIHELVHCITGHEHNAVFMKVEDLLLQMWDVRIVRKKVYPKQVFYKEDEITNIPYIVAKALKSHRHRVRLKRRIHVDE